MNRVFKGKVVDSCTVEDDCILLKVDPDGGLFHAPASLAPVKPGDNVEFVAGHDWQVSAVHPLISLEGHVLGACSKTHGQAVLVSNQGDEFRVGFSVLGRTTAGDRVRWFAIGSAFHSLLGIDRQPIPREPRLPETWHG